jgi:hypothetical protein
LKLTADHLHQLLDEHLHLQLHDTQLLLPPREILVRFQILSQEC